MNSFYIVEVILDEPRLEGIYRTYKEAKEAVKTQLGKTIQVSGFLVCLTKQDFRIHQCKRIKTITPATAMRR